MEGLLSSYDSNLSLDHMYCLCGKTMGRIKTGTYQRVFRCESCLTIIEYKRDYSCDDWELGEVTKPELLKPKIDGSVLNSVLMKLDAIATHLGVELVNIPEHYDAIEDPK